MHEPDHFARGPGSVDLSGGHTEGSPLRHIPGVAIDLVRFGSVCPALPPIERPKGKTMAPAMVLRRRRGSVEFGRRAAVIAYRGYRNWFSVIPVCVPMRILGFSDRSFIVFVVSVGCSRAIIRNNREILIDVTHAPTPLTSGSSFG
jgi:hypothetical protein